MFEEFDPRPVPIKGGRFIYGNAMFRSIKPDQSGFWEDWLLVWASDFDELDYKLLK